uniref:Uncharacterized protein n=1 Tax=Timema cristinae TaxID=61476 RepID=A0A7R9DD22_TIMCR|nr:unnamed protein product [Timema cristinae]
MARPSISSSQTSEKHRTADEYSQTRFSVSGRSTQASQIVCKSLRYVVENYGTTLPVLVTEASTFADHHVFEAMMYVDNSIDYSKPESVIDNLQVIKDIVKKSGMKPRVVAPPDVKESDKLRDRDAVRQ